MQSITFRVEPVKATGVGGLLGHDMRRPDYDPEGRRLPNYVVASRMSENHFVRRCSPEELKAEFDRRLAIKNAPVEEHNRKRNALVDALVRGTGMARKDARKKVGGFKRTLKASAVHNRMFRGLVGLSNDALIARGWFRNIPHISEEERTKVNEILITAFEIAIEKLGLTMVDVTHCVVHWDESNPHLQFGLHYFDSKGKTFRDDITQPLLCEIVSAVNSIPGFSRPIPYEEQRASGGKVDKHKSTKEMKKEHDILAHANHVVRGGLDDTLKKAKDAEERQRVAEEAEASAILRRRSEEVRETKAKANQDRIKKATDKGYTKALEEKENVLDEVEALRAEADRLEKNHMKRLRAAALLDKAGRSQADIALIEKLQDADWCREQGLSAEQALAFREQLVPDQGLEM